MAAYLVRRLPAAALKVVIITPTYSPRQTFVSAEVVVCELAEAIGTSDDGARPAQRRPREGARARARALVAPRDRAARASFWHSSSVHAKHCHNHARAVHLGTRASTCDGLHSARCVRARSCPHALAVAHSALMPRRRKRTVQQSFDTTNRRFLMNEAIMASRQNLPDPDNPAPNRCAGLILS